MQSRKFFLCFSDTEDTEEDDSSDSDSDYGSYDDFLLDYYDGDNDETYNATSSESKQLARFPGGSHNETWMCNHYYHPIFRCVD